MEHDGQPRRHHARPRRQRRHRRHLHVRLGRAIPARQPEPRRHGLHHAAVLHPRRERRRPEAPGRALRRGRRFGAGDRRHADCGIMAGGRRSALVARGPHDDQRHRVAGHQRRRAADLLPRRHHAGGQHRATADAGAARRRAGSVGRQRKRAAQDQPRHLRHELRRRGAGGRSAPAGTPVGRQLHLPLQLAKRHDNTGSDWYFENVRRIPVRRTRSSTRTAAPARGR